MKLKISVVLLCLGGTLSGGTSSASTGFSKLFFECPKLATFHVVVAPQVVNGFEAASNVAGTYFPFASTAVIGTGTMICKYKVGTGDAVELYAQPAPSGYTCVTHEASGFACTMKYK